MHRHPNGSGLIGNGTGDGLPDPPSRICREFVSLCPVKLVHRANQAGVALLNQIQDVQPSAGILLRNGNHQPEVGLGELVLRRLIPFGDPLCQLHFLLGGQQVDLTDLLQVHPHGVVQVELGGQIHRVDQLFLLDGSQLQSVVQVIHPQIQVVLQLQIQLGADDLNVHGLKSIIDFLDLLGGQIHLLQRGMQLRGLDHALLASLGDQGLEGGKGLVAALSGLFHFAHSQAPLCFSLSCIRGMTIYRFSHFDKGYFP